MTQICKFCAQPFKPHPAADPNLCSACAQLENFGGGRLSSAPDSAVTLWSYRTGRESEQSNGLDLLRGASQPPNPFTGRCKGCGVESKYDLCAVCAIREDREEWDDAESAAGHADAGGEK